MTGTYEKIIYTVSNRIARITLNAPEKRNALSFQMRDELISALKSAESDDEVSLILLDGAGPSFCSGYDLSARDPEYKKSGWVESIHFDNWTDQFARSCARDWLTIWDLLKPVIAKVHGHCVAGGTEILSMVDIAFEADDARIGYPPMRGMTTPDTLYFPWKMSMARAKYLQLTGNSVTGKEAAEMGWVAKSFPADELEDQVMRELRPMAKIAPDLISANKKSLNQAYEIMGFKTAISMGWSWHTLSGHVRPGAGDFRDAMRDGGLKEALDWRDGDFREEGFV